MARNTTTTRRPQRSKRDRDLARSLGLTFVAHRLTCGCDECRLPNGKPRRTR